MGLEIERKFLVRSDRWRAHADGGTPLIQGYLCADRQRSVRLRVAADRAWLTVKGPTTGTSRAEFEFAIPRPDAVAMLDLCRPQPVEKTRYRVDHAGHTWEIDVFGGANAPLVMAEVELTREGEPVALPDWVGDEVTGDDRYRNASLARRPFSSW